MKAKELELSLHHWPYGLEVQPSAQGLLLRPRRKARANWAKAFRHPRPSQDDLAPARQVTNEFDLKEWEW
jgi:hypothetical protein